MKRKLSFFKKRYTLSSFIPLTKDTFIFKVLLSGEGKKVKGILPEITRTHVNNNTPIATTMGIIGKRIAGLINKLYKTKRNL